MPPGSLTIPNLFTNAVAPTQPFALLDQDLTTIRDYINTREITRGLLANRPAPGTPGAWYQATDVSGGTLYIDDGSAWQQAAPGVTIQAPQNTVVILASYHLASFGG